MLCQSTPSDRKDVSGVKGAPIIKGTSPAVKHDENLLTSDLSHCGWTNQVGVLPVHCLELHTRLEIVLRRTDWFLNKHIH